MKRGIIVLFLVFAVSAGFCASDDGIGVDSVSMVSAGDSCTLSSESINAVKDFIASEMNTGNLAFSNVTNSYCYSSGDYSSFSVTVLFKENESSILGRSVNAYFYSQDTYDYSIVFSADELDKLDYTLKDKYVKYLINGTSEDFYVILYSYDDCSALESYYDSLLGEKYFNQDSCSIVTKISTSDIKGLSGAPADYVSYLGDSVNFVFSGYSEGSYDLESIADTISCDVSERYYFEDVGSDCYAVYVDKSRLYFSSSTTSDDSYTYFSAYGIIGGKVEFSVSAYGDGLSDADVQSWVNIIMSAYFPEYSLSVSFDNSGEYYKYYSVVKDGFSFDNYSLSNFDVENYEMNTVYSSGDTYVTVTEPYLQVYFTDYPVLTSSLVVPYWSNYFTVTSNKVYAMIALSSEDEAVAEQSLNELVNGYVSVNDWVLDLNVGGGWYYPYPLRGGIGADYSVSGSAEDSSNSQLLDLLQSETAGNIGSMNVSKFEELEDLSNQNWLTSIINFFTNLFK